MDSAKKIHATLGIFVLKLFPTMIQMILKDNITPGKLHRMFINKTLNTVLTDADVDLMKMLPNMDNFTIDICYKILRFENLIDEPKCKWGNSPDDSDVEISDDIQRILNFSNAVISKSSEEITKIFPTTFEENVKRIIERVDEYLKVDTCQQLYKNLHIQHIDTSELLDILEHLLRKHPIKVIPSILTTDGKTMMRELYSRIAIVVTDIFPNILRDIIQSQISPHDLYKKCDTAFFSSCFSEQKTYLKTLNLENSFSFLDIPLIYKLLRHFSLIPPPSKGWGMNPNPTDLLIADDVERIRMFRNEIAHRCDANITKNSFDAYFVRFSEIGERIDNYFNGQNGYEQKVIACKICSMDNQMQTKYEKAAKELENLKLHYERKPVKFYWGDTFEQSLIDLRMMIQNEKLEGNEKFRVLIILQIEGDMNSRTVSILNSLRGEINQGLKGIDFVCAFTGSVVLCVDILVEEMETDEKLQLLLYSFMTKIIQTEVIGVTSTEYVDVVLTHSEENTLFEMTKKETNTSSVVYLDFNIDASHFETDKKMEVALSDIVENFYNKASSSGIKGDIKARVLPMQFDFCAEMVPKPPKDDNYTQKPEISQRCNPPPSCGSQIQNIGTSTKEQEMSQRWKPAPSCGTNINKSSENVPRSNRYIESSSQTQTTVQSTKVHVRVQAGEMMFSNVNERATGTAILEGLTEEEMNFTKMGMIALNILADVLYDLLKPDKPHLRSRCDCDITYLYSEHRKLNKHVPSNSNHRRCPPGPWGGNWLDIQNTDIAIGDDIERIRLTRNELQRSQIFKLDEIRFNELCNILSDLLKRLDQHNKPTRLYTDGLNEILAKTISAEEAKSIENSILGMTIEVEIEH